MRKLVFVEDTYGIQFHRVIMEKLKDIGVLGNDFNPKIERLPTGKCNPGLRSKIIARTDREAKVLIIIDTESNLNKVKSCIEEIFKEVPDNIRIDTIYVDPKHESWLCIGLGGDRVKCRQDPEHELRRLKSVRDYSKDYLSKWAKDVDVSRLRGETDFKDYENKLKQLEQDP
jgi:type II secretory pathway component GspD/PulD (secretin)